MKTCESGFYARFYSPNSVQRPYLVLLLDPIPEIKKATRKRLTIVQKLDIADLLDKEHCAEAIERQFGIAGRTVRNIRATAPPLLRIAMKTPQSLQKKPHEIPGLLGELKVLATECQVSDALSYLRSAKRAFLTTKRGRELTRSRQTIITECMNIDVTTSPINPSPNTTVPVLGSRTGRYYSNVMLHLEMNLPDGSFL